MPKKKNSPLVSVRNRNLDQEIKGYLTRLGRTDLQVSRDRSRWGPDGDIEWYNHPTEVDLSNGESYFRGRPEDILPVLRKLKPGMEPGHTHNNS